MITSQHRTNLNNDQFEDILIYFSKSLLGKDNEEDILWDLAKNCIAKLGFVDCVVYLIDEHSEFLIQKSAYGPKNPKDFKLYNPVKIALGTGITGSVALYNKAEIIYDTSKDNRYIIDDQKRSSEICVPIADDNTIYGVIDCEHPDKGFFTAQHLKMLSAIASICAIKIKSVRDHNILIQKKEKLLLLKEELIDLKIKTINSQLNPHFVFNTLNSIQYFITSEQKKSALDYLSIFSKFIRLYLKNLKSEKGNLKDEINMLIWYLKLQKLRYNDRFHYTININKESEMASAIIPSFVIQTLFENMIEHAIFNQHQNEALLIDFHISKTYVILNIKYEHEPLQTKINYMPEYRQHIVKWQDQIRLLNTSKGYQIEKNINFFKDKKVHGGYITLKLPNLASI